MFHETDALHLMHFETIATLKVIKTTLKLGQTTRPAKMMQLMGLFCLSSATVLFRMAWVLRWMVAKSMMHQLKTVIDPMIYG